MSENLQIKYSNKEKRLVQKILKNIRENTPKYIRNERDLKAWETRQLNLLEDFQKENRIKMSELDQKALLRDIKDEVMIEYDQGRKDALNGVQEAKKDGFDTVLLGASAIAIYTAINNRKVNTIAKELTDGLYKSEILTYKRSEFLYRQIISTVVNNYKTNGDILLSIDQAIKPIVVNGIPAIQFEDGRMTGLDNYSDLLFTASKKRAYLQGEASLRDEYGLSLIIVGYRKEACEKCLPYVGRILIDDVFGSGVYSDDPRYPLLSEAMDSGLYHPNCKDSHTTYFPGMELSEFYHTLTDAEKETALYKYNVRQKENYYKRQVEKYNRLRTYSMSPRDIFKYNAAYQKWSNIEKDFVSSHKDVF